MTIEDSKNKKLSLVKEFFFGFILAVSFLTRIPLKSSNPNYYNPEVWQRSTAFYPLCGYIISAFIVLPLYILLVYFTKTALSLIFIVPFIYVAFSEWMTRMLHFDGFCDCADAFSAMSASKEKRLEIMKDPHVGSSALGAGTLLIIGKLIPLYLFVYFNKVFALLISIAAITVLARLAMLFLASCGKYPRKEGTSLMIIGKVPLSSLVIASVSAVPVLFLIFKFISLSAMLASIAVMIFTFFYWKIKADRKIGGVTGDVLGACCESTELILALVLLVFSLSV